MKKLLFIFLWLTVLVSNSFIASTIQHTMENLIDLINTGEIDKIKSIVPQYIQASEKTPGGKTILEHALRHKQDAIVDYLVSTIDLEEFISFLRNGELLDLLIPAIEQGKIAIVKAIVPAKVPADQKTKGGKAIGKIATENGQNEVAEYLQLLTLKEAVQCEPMTSEKKSSETKLNS